MRLKWWRQEPLRSETLAIGGLTVTFDPWATKNADWRSCECEACCHFRDFAAASLSKSLQKVLADFGLTPDNAAYTTLTDADSEKSLTRYEGHYVVFGQVTGGDRTPDFGEGTGCVYWVDRAAWTGNMFDYPGGYSVPNLDAPHFFVNFKTDLPGDLSDMEVDGP